MLPSKIHALNDNSSDESDVDEDNPTITREALEEKAFIQYREILSLQRENNLDAAEAAFKTLLDSDILAKTSGKLGPVTCRAQHSLLHMKYCCLKNLGNIFIQKKEFKTSLDFYMQAVDIDNADVTVWFRIGRISMKIADLNLAISAFLEGLRCNPRHWPCLDNIITVFYAVGDFLACLLYIYKAFQLDPDFCKGHIFIEEISKKHPTVLKNFNLFYPECVIDERTDSGFELEEIKFILDEVDQLRNDDLRINRPLPIEKNPPPQVLKSLTKKTWLNLGLALLNFHEDLTTANSSTSTNIFCKLKLKEEEEESKQNGDTSTEDMEVESCLQNAEQATPGTRNKRKRSSPTLAEQLRYSDKRRSARVRDTTRKQEPSLARTLCNLIPRSLMPQKEESNKDYDVLRWMNEDSMDTMDIYRLFENKEGCSRESSTSLGLANNLSLDSRIRLIQGEKYFDTCEETNDVKNFLAMNDGKSISEILVHYALRLSSKWSLLWPLNLSSVFLKICKLLRSRGPQSSHTIFVLQQTDSESKLDTPALSEAKVFLLYCELLLDEWLQKENEDKEKSLLGDSLLGGTLSTLMLGELFEVCSATNDIILNTRSCWLEALLYLYHGETFTAVNAFSSIICSVDDDFSLNLPNQTHNSVISKSVAQKYLDSLNWNELLHEIPSLKDRGQYSEIVRILKECLNDTNPVLEAAQPILDRFEQYSTLLDCLIELDNFADCFAYCEASCHEALNSYRSCYLDENAMVKKVRYICIVNRCLQGMLACIETAGIDVVMKLKEGRATRLIQTLSNILCHQSEYNDASTDETISCIIPWILLFHLVKSTETQSETVDSVPMSLQVLFTAHDYLGRKTWCLHDDASVLYLILNLVEPILQIPTLDPEIRLALMQQADQIFFCLYQHPLKRNKPRHIVDHNVLGLALTWSRAIQLYRFYKPLEIPAFDSNKSYAISGDFESLVKRLIPLIPKELNPSHLMEGVMAYLNCESEVIPDVSPLLPVDIEDCFYFLGDYHFKSKNWGKAIKYYMQDVCHNSARVDSWAAMALARGGQIETKLNSCESIKSEEDFLDQAMMASQCYKKALEIDAQHPTLWIEYGSFSYMLHSFCSRLLKQETTNLSLELFATLEEQKEKMLQTSFECFTAANKVYNSLEIDGNYMQDERWLHHFMLGKIAEKREEPVKIYVEHYLKSIELLHSNGAQYPATINYSNPQFYAVEALELYFRIHCSILKQIELSESKPLPQSTRQLFKTTIGSLMKSPFATHNHQIGEIKLTDSENVYDMNTKDDDFSVSSLLDVTELMANILEKISSYHPNNGKDSGGDETHTALNVKKRKRDEIANSAEEIEVLDASKNGKKVKVEDNNIDVKTEDDLEVQRENKNLETSENAHDEKTESVKTEIKWETPEEKKRAEESSSISIKSSELMEIEEVIIIKDDKDTNETEANLKDAMDLEDENLKAKLALLSSDENETEDDNANDLDAKENTSPIPLTPPCAEENGIDEKSLEKVVDDENLKAKLALLSSEENSSSSASSSSSSSSGSSDSSESSGSSTSSSSGSSSSSSSSSSSENSKSSSTDSKTSDTGSVSESSSGKGKAKKRKLNIIVKKDEKKENWEAVQWELTKQCLNAIKECSKRFPEHYKSLYRLAHFYFRSKTYRDVKECRSILLGPQGLFSDRRFNNFFNGVWRIPSGEVDRAGSFAYHMSRCVHLVIDLLRDLKDFLMLLELSIQLRDMPEPDKKYLRDNEREQLSKEAFSLSLNTVRKLSQESFSSSNAGKKETQRSLLLDVFKCYNKVSKHWPQREQLFAKILTDCYQKYYSGKSPTTGNILESAVRFCAAVSSTMKAATTSSSMSVNSPSQITKPPSQISTTVATPSPASAKPSAIASILQQAASPKPKPPAISQVFPTLSNPAKLVARPGKSPMTVGKNPKKEPMYVAFEAKMFELIKAVKLGLEKASALTDAKHFPPNVLFQERAAIVQYLLKKYEEQEKLSFAAYHQAASAFYSAAAQNAFNQQFLKFHKQMKRKTASPVSLPLPSVSKDLPNVSITPVGSVPPKISLDPSQQKDSKAKKLASSKQVINFNQAKQLAQSTSPSTSQSSPKSAATPPLRKPSSPSFQSYTKNKNIIVSQSSSKTIIKPKAKSTDLLSKPICASGAVSISKTTPPGMNKSHISIGGSKVSGSGAAAPKTKPSSLASFLPAHITKLGSVSLSQSISLTAVPTPTKSATSSKDSMSTQKPSVSNKSSSGSKPSPSITKSASVTSRSPPISKPSTPPNIKSMSANSGLSITRSPIISSSSSGSNKIPVSSGAVSIKRAKPPPSLPGTSKASPNTAPALSISSTALSSEVDIQKIFPKDLTVTTVDPQGKETSLNSPVSVINLQSKGVGRQVSSPKASEPQSADVVSNLKAFNKSITIFPTDKPSKKT